MARSNSTGTIIFRADQLEREWREFPLCVRCRRGRASKFGNYFLNWLERAGSSISQSRTLTLRLPRRLSLFLTAPSAPFSVSRFCCSSFAHHNPLSFPREHNYRLRVPSQWMVNGKPYSETPTYHHKPLVNSDLEKRFRGSAISAHFSRGSNRAICLTLDRLKVSFYINERRFNYLLTLLPFLISVFDHTLNAFVCAKRMCIEWYILLFWYIWSKCQSIQFLNMIK